MATKAELESASRHYHHYLVAAKTAIQAGNIFAAIQNSVASLSSIDGMMQFERKSNQREFNSIETIELILTYSPVIFDSESLDRLADVLKSQKRIDKNASADIAKNLKTARQQLNNSYQLWLHLLQFPNHTIEAAMENVGAPKEWLTWLVQYWEMQGYARRIELTGKTHVQVMLPQDEIVSAKCPGCGVVGNGKKWQFWNTNTCPKCKHQVVFVMIKKQ